MSLKAFHVVFISASVLLAFAAGVGLAAYEAWFVRKMRRLP
jgi:hypothetical protein